MMNANARRVLVGCLAAAISFAAASSLTGCKRAVLGVNAPIAGYDEATAGVTTSIDVVNTSGSVLVYADKRWKKPEVYLKAKSDKTKRLKVIPEWLHVDSVLEQGRPVLRVRCDAPIAGENGGDETFTNRLVVRVPACTDITIRNGGGSVEVIGVTGSIDVQNGYENRTGGDVIVRTDAPITTPVLVYTTEGNANCQIGLGSTGQVEVSSDQGKAEVRARSTPFTGIRNPSDTRWVGTMNNGTNAVVVRTGKGIARLLVHEDSAEFRPRGDPEREFNW